jgi:hypothetical protein
VVHTWGRILRDVERRPFSGHYRSATLWETSKVSGPRTDFFGVADSGFTLVLATLGRAKLRVVSKLIP